MTLDQIKQSLTKTRYPFPLIRTQMMAVCDYPYSERMFQKHLKAMHEDGFLKKINNILYEISA